MRDNKTMRLSEILDKHYKRLKYGRGENSRGLGDASPKDTEPLDMGRPRKVKMVD